MTRRQLAFTSLFAALAFSLSISAQVRAQSKEDAQKFAEARIAIDKYKDCPASLKALESISEEGRKNPLWAYYMAKNQECQNNLEAALKYYEQYSALVSADAELIDKIADLRYRVTRNKDKSKLFADVFNELYPNGTALGIISYSSGGGYFPRNIIEGFKISKSAGCSFVFHNHSSSWANETDISVSLGDLMPGGNIQLVQFKGEAETLFGNWATLFVTRNNKASIVVKETRGDFGGSYAGIAFYSKDRAKAERIKQSIEEAINYCSSR